MKYGIAFLTLALAILIVLPLELFDFSQFQLRYVSRRPPNQKHLKGNGIQLLMEGLV